MKIVVCSGAGLSVASGLPTFRCQGGLWEQFKIEEVCYLPTFLQNYIKCNEFYEARRKQLANVKPNPAHISLAQAEQLTGVEIVHFTTNVDDLLEQAGCTNVTHMHGNLKELVLNWRTPEERIVPAENFDWTADEYYPVKPNVVFFNESAPVYEDVYNTFTQLQAEDYIVIVGSSEEVFSFSYTAKYMCSTKATVVYIGPERPMSCCEDLWLKTKAEELDFVELIKTFKNKV